MATIGNPLMDLGTALGYWVEAGDPPILQKFRFGPTTLPGMASRRTLAERYQERSGCELGDMLFYYVFGLFKIAVIEPAKVAFLLNWNTLRVRRHWAWGEPS